MRAKYNLIFMWGSKGTGNGQFEGPSGIAVDGGYVYVTDWGNNRFLKFTSIGKYVDTWGNYGHGWGEFGFDKPWGIAADRMGNLFIADCGNSVIQQWRSDGVFVDKWGRHGKGGGGFSWPAGVAVDSAGNIFTADGGNGQVQVFGFLGHVFLAIWGGIGMGEDGKFKECVGAQGIAVDTDMYVYVSDTGWNRIQKFTWNGQFVMKWGVCGNGRGEFNSPRGIAVDASGNVYVADSGNHRIQKFTSDGAFITTWGSNGTANGQFQNPTGVAVDSAGNVYVADTGNNRIQRFAPALEPDFTADRKSGFAPLNVQFTDLTTNGIPQKWSWKFGDRQTSDLKEPIHTYTKPGTYRVTLTVSNTFQGSNDRTKSNYITVSRG